jgi:hypothetical protein
MPWQDDVALNELDGEPEAAPEIRRYLALADIALRPKRLFLVERRADNKAPKEKRAA